MRAVALSVLLILVGRVYAFQCSGACVRQHRGSGPFSQRQQHRFSSGEFCIHAGTQRIRHLLRASVSEDEATRPSAVKVSYPTPDEGVAMGIREWPGFLKKENSFAEDVEVGATRYILEGSGSCTPLGEDAIELEPGTLIECTASTTLEWHVSSPLVILTPTFEQTKLFAGFAVALFGG